MEAVLCKLSAADFDDAVHNGLKEGGDLAFFVKTKATEGGKPAIVVTFTVELPGGGLARAQCVTTLANMKNVLAILNGWESSGFLS